MKPDDLQLPVDTAWLRRNAPREIEFGSMGFARIPFKPLRGWGEWRLVLWRLLAGRRRVDLQARPVEGTNTAATAFTEIGTVHTRRGLIKLYNRLSATPWPTDH